MQGFTSTPLGHNSHMQMILPRTLRVADPLLEDPLRLLDELPVQINRVPVHPAHGVVLPEDVVRRLLVVLVRQRAVSLALFRELVRGAAVAASVGLVGLRTCQRGLARVGGSQRESIAFRVSEREVRLGFTKGFGNRSGKGRPWRDMKSACQPLGGQGRAGDRTRLRWSWIGAGG